MDVKKILITGVYGLLGSMLAASLKDEYKVITLLIVLLTVTACGASDDEVHSIVEQALQNQPTPTATAVLIPTATSITSIYLPVPTATPRPTATPIPAPITSFPSLDVRPFQNQGVGIQFWGQPWMPSVDDPMRAEFIESLDLLTEMNINYVSIHYNVKIDDSSPNGVVFDRNTDVTLTDAQFYDLVARLKERGFIVNLKIGFWHPDPEFSMGKYMPNDEDLWFTNWGKELVYFATLSEQAGVDAFDVAYEMANLTTDQKYTAQWNTIIDGVEAVYNGQITANFLNPVEAQKAVFLNRLDTVMTSIFYKHVATVNNNPTVAELVKSWTDTSTDLDSVIDMNKWGIWGINDSIMNEIEAIHTISGKPVMIGDMAFISLDGAASNWNSNFGIQTNPASNDDQTNQYEAFFQAASQLDRSWFKGVLFLTWFPFDSTNPTGPYADWSYEIGPQGRTFRGKPAEQLIIDKFGGQ